ncbi:MAG: hypothetical protein N2200_09255 [Bacteroidia bacterium]|nr:hypothetical protein [Bacteroidia bacterium]
MLWVADAGASKTDWMEAQSRWSLRTEGLNAEVEGWQRAKEKLFRAAQLLREAGKDISVLYYYGPALHREETREKMRYLLAETLRLPVEKTFVYHDLLGAARAAWGGQAGVVCILGTGSNCALWDGERIHRQAGGHGYLLGDEGSGADLGKAFLSALLHQEVPADLEEAFWNWCPFAAGRSLIHLRSLAYASPQPSAFLGEFVPFLAEKQSHPWVRALVMGRLGAFIQRTWGGWLSKLPIRYIGGVANAFEPLLQETTRKYGGVWGGVVSRVCEALVAYHVQR